MRAAVRISAYLNSCLEILRMRNQGRNMTGRQRAGLRLGMIGLIGQCLTGAMLSSIAAETAWGSGEPVSPSQIQSMRLLTTTTGWVAGNRGFALTHDGGQRGAAAAPRGGDAGGSEGGGGRGGRQGGGV